MLPQAQTPPAPTQAASPEAAGRDPLLVSRLDSLLEGLEETAQKIESVASAALTHTNHEAAADLSASIHQAADTRADESDDALASHSDSIVDDLAALLAEHALQQPATSDTVTSPPSPEPASVTESPVVAPTTDAHAADAPAASGDGHAPMAQDEPSIASGPVLARNPLDAPEAGHEASVPGASQTSSGAHASPAQNTSPTPPQPEFQTSSPTPSPGGPLSIEALDAQLAKLSDELASGAKLHAPLPAQASEDSASGHSPSAAHSTTPTADVRASPPPHPSAPAPLTVAPAHLAPKAENTAVPQGGLSEATSTSVAIETAPRVGTLVTSTAGVAQTLSTFLLRLASPLAKPLATQLPLARTVIGLAAIYSLALGGWASYYAAVVRPTTFATPVAAAFNLHNSSLPHAPEHSTPPHGAAGAASAEGAHGAAGSPAKADAHGGAAKATDKKATGKAAKKSPKKPPPKTDANAKKPPAKKDAAKADAKGGH